MNLSNQHQQFLDQINSHRKILYKLAFVYCRRSEDRKDLIQEMLIQLWRSYDRFDGRVKFSTWVYRVAANTAISFYRYEQHGKPDIVSIDDLGVDIAAADDAFGESVESMQLLRRLIEQMDDQRFHAALYVHQRDCRAAVYPGITLDQPEDFRSFSTQSRAEENFGQFVGAGYARESGFSGAARSGWIITMTGAEIRIDIVPACKEHGAFSCNNRANYRITAQRPNNRVTCYLSEFTRRNRPS